MKFQHLVLNISMLAGTMDRRSLTTAMCLYTAWKTWLHFGTSLTFSPSANSPRQIEQSVTVRFSPDSYAVAGIWLNALFVRPVLVEGSSSSAGICSEVHRPKL